MKIIAIDYNDNNKEILKQMVQNGHTVYTKKDGQFLSLFVENGELSGSKIDGGKVLDLIGIEPRVTEITPKNTPCNVTGCPTSDDISVLKQSVAEHERRLLEVENVLSKPLLPMGN